MITKHCLYKILYKQNIKFFAGVPDSLLSHFSKELEYYNKESIHIICPNEGNAVSAAIGYYAATTKIPAVYMQNSGLGNAINPLISLAHKKVWAVPMVLIIGWRGSYGIKDEPQHIQQGKITKNFLNLLGIEFEVFKDLNNLNSITKLITKAKKNKLPVAILFKKKYISPAFKNINKINKKQNKLTRYEAIKTIKNYLQENDIIISTTGKTSRELYLINNKCKKKHSDLFVVGGMGHSSSIALGILNSSQKKRLFLLDGDGAMLMHLGILSLLGKQTNNTFVHILLNNKVHDSVGGQSTSISNVNLSLLSKSMKYKYYKLIKTKNSLQNYLKKIRFEKSSYFINLEISAGSVKSLPRPIDHPSKNFELFQKKINVVISK